MNTRGSISEPDGREADKARVIRYTTMAGITGATALRLRWANSPPRVAPHQVRAMAGTSSRGWGSAGRLTVNSSAQPEVNPLASWRKVVRVGTRLGAVSASAA